MLNDLPNLCVKRVFVCLRVRLRVFAFVSVSVSFARFMRVQAYDCFFSWYSATIIQSVDQSSTSLDDIHCQWIRGRICFFFHVYD